MDSDVIAFVMVVVIVSFIAAATAYGCGLGHGDQRTANRFNRDTYYNRTLDDRTRAMLQSTARFRSHRMYYEVAGPAQSYHVETVINLLRAEYHDDVRAILMAGPRIIAMLDGSRAAAHAALVQQQ